MDILDLIDRALDDVSVSRDAMRIPGNGALGIWQWHAPVGHSQARFVGGPHADEIHVLLATDDTWAFPVIPNFSAVSFVDGDPFEVPMRIDLYRLSYVAGYSLRDEQGRYIFNYVGRR